MKTVKAIAMLLCVLLIPTALCACGDVIVEPTWVVGTRGVQAPVFTSIDYAKLKEKTLECKVLRADGSAMEGTWEGLYLEDVLDYLDASDYSSITLTFTDGSEQTYTRAHIEDSAAFFATACNGSALKEEGMRRIWVIAANHAPQLAWTESLKRITVNE